MIGAALCFIGLYIYLILQTVISHRLSFVLYSTKMIFIFRLILILIGLIFVVLCPLYGNFSFRKFNGKDPMKWLPNDGVSIYA